MEHCCKLLWIVVWMAIITVNVWGLCLTPVISNGWSQIRMRGRIVYYFCDKGYQLYGNRTAKCIHNNWHLPTPTCVATGCDGNFSVTNGVIEKLYNGSVLTVSCVNDTILRGRKHVYCDGRTWSTTPPQCLAPEDITFCDFENEGMCGWKQDGHDDFDWTIWSGETPTARTGPMADHTYDGKSRAGHYIYMEASAPRRMNHTTRLLSPLYPPDKGGRCFRVWLHMLGPSSANDVGTLNIKLKEGVEPFTNLSVLLSVSGNQGPRWKSSIVYIPKTNRPYQIQLEAIRQRSYVSDIAVDDLEFYDCVPTTTLSSTSRETTTVFSSTTTTSTTTVTTEALSTLSNKKDLRDPQNLQMSPLDVDGSGEESHMTVNISDILANNTEDDNVNVTRNLLTTESNNNKHITDSNRSTVSKLPKKQTTVVPELSSFNSLHSSTESITFSHSDNVVLSTNIQKSTLQNNVQHVSTSQKKGILKSTRQMMSKDPGNTNPVTVIVTHTTDTPYLQTVRKEMKDNMTREYLDVVQVDVDDGTQIVTLSVSVIVVTVFISILMLFIVLCKRRQRKYEEKYTEMKRFVETHYRTRYI